MTVFGPLDRRILRRRCVACTRRKIKVRSIPIFCAPSNSLQCDGGPPCLYCIKKNQECIPQALPLKVGEVFINISAPSTRDNSVAVVPAQPLPLYSKVPQNISTQFVKHFFSVFLATNDFGGAPDLKTIIAEFQTSSTLYHAIMAVGALDMSNKSLPSSAAKRKAAAVGALKAYSTSVVHFQSEIETKRFQDSDANLWTTLFLGLFEVSSLKDSLRNARSLGILTGCSS
jgi:hypothetical protein